jgi:hypothetical protein
MPEVVEFYKSTKGGADTFDQVCHSFTCSRTARRWQLRVFYGTIYTGGINSYAIWTINETSKGNNKINRLDF